MMLTMVQKDSVFEFYNENSVGVGSIAVELTQSDMIINSVYTVHEFRGQGMARVMMDQVYAYAMENKLTIKPICSYAVAYLEKKGH